MKTTTNTTQRALNAATTDRTHDKDHEGPERMPHRPTKAPVPYPNLEDYVPDDCHTTQDPPKYGTDARPEEGQDSP